MHIRERLRRWRHRGNQTAFEYKQVIVIRSDIKMSRGKIAVQTAHAAVTAAEEARRQHHSWWQKWLREGQKKVVVKASTKEELLTLKDEAEKLGLPCKLIRDRGLTEIQSGTLTAVGIGPAPKAEVDKVTGNLPLL